MNNYPNIDKCVEYVDITSEVKNNDGHTVIACACDGVYLGFMSFDNDANYYMFHPASHQDTDDVIWSESILYDLGERLYILNKERRLN